MSFAVSHSSPTAFGNQRTENGRKLALSFLFSFFRRKISLQTPMMQTMSLHVNKSKKEASNDFSRIFSAFQR